MIKLFRKLFGVKQPTQLERINRDVNRQVWYVKDKEGKDTLTASLDLREGDCEDIAATKLLHLVKEGFDRSKLSPLMCCIKNGVWHLVLCVVDGIEVKVLDNLTDEVYSLDKMKHTPWYKTSGGTYYRAKKTQEKYEKLFDAL